MDDNSKPLPAVPVTPVVAPKAEPKPEPLPSSGGSYRRNADGTLTQVTFPTAPPGKIYDKDGQLVDVPPVAPVTPKE